MSNTDSSTSRKPGLAKAIVLGAIIGLVVGSVATFGAGALFQVNDRWASGFWATVLLGAPGGLFLGAAIGLASRFTGPSSTASETA